MNSKKVLKAAAICLVPIIGILWLTLTSSGFCYNKGRWLSEREIIESVRPVNMVGLASCRVSGSPHDLNAIDLISNVLVGRKLSEVECILPRSEDSAYLELITVHACAAKIIDTSGMNISKKSYDEIIKKNQTYWQEKIK